MIKSNVSLMLIAHFNIIALVYEYKKTTDSQVSTNLVAESAVCYMVIIY